MSAPAKRPSAAPASPREITVPPGLASPLPPAPEPAPAVVVSAATAHDESDDENDDDENDRTVLAPPRRPRPTWILVMPDGSRQSIAGVTVVGRRPAKTAFPGADKSLILKDPDGQVSKSHAVFEVDPEGLWVRDLDSTNGVVVVGTGGEETTVSGSDRVKVEVGFEVELGGFVLTIERDGV